MLRFFKIAVSSALLAWIVSFTFLHAQLGGFGEDVQLAQDSALVFDTTTADIPDTLILQGFNIENLYSPAEPSGIALNARSRQAEVARQGLLEQAHLGNQGSAMRALAYSGLEELGIRMGVEGFEPWLWHARDLSLYRQNQAVSEFNFVQTTDQQNIRFDASFARNIMENLNFSLQYRRINHLGQYENQRTKYALINTGLWYHSPNDRFHSALVYTTNNIQVETNGGVTTDTLFEEEERQVRLTIPVELERAGITILRRSMHSHNSYMLWDRPLGTLRLTYDIQYLQDEHRFTDENITQGEGTFYKTLAVDPRGIRNAYRYRHWENSVGFRLNIKKGEASSTITGKLKHIFRKEDLQFATNNTTPLHLVGSWVTYLNSNYSLNVNGSLGINEERGDYTLSANIQGKIAPGIKLVADARSGRYDPGWVYRTSYITGILLYDNSLMNTQQDQLGATLRVWQDRLQLGGRIFRTNGFTYFDEDFEIIQNSDDLFLQRLEIKWSLPWRSLTFEGLAFWQNYDEPMFGMPDQYVKAGIKYQDFWFRDNLEVVWGVEARYTDRYLLPGWQPALMSFYSQGESRATSHIPVDLYFQFKIDAFRAFIQAENLSDTWSPGIYYGAANHPMNEFLIRFGFEWQMLR